MNEEYSIYFYAEDDTEELRTYEVLGILETCSVNLSRYQQLFLK